MPSSTTRIVKNTVIAESGAATVLVRLMMVVNDMGIVNDSLREWSTSTDKRRMGRKGGGRVFFARMQMAYVYEALNIIKEIRDSEALMDQVQKCEKKTRECFTKVCEFLDSPDYKKLIQVRNSVGFHYDPKRALRAIKEIAAEHPDNLSAMTLGHDLLDWHFVLGDKAQDKIIVRYIFEVPKEADIGKASDEIAGRIFDMAENLAEFSGYFVWEVTKF